MTEEETITIEDLKKAAKQVRENSPCTCKIMNSIYCPKHAILKITKEELKMLKEELKI